MTIPVDIVTDGLLYRFVHWMSEPRWNVCHSQVTKGWWDYRKGSMPISISMSGTSWHTSEPQQDIIFTVFCWISTFFVQMVQYKDFRMHVSNYKLWWLWRYLSLYPPGYEVGGTSEYINAIFIHSMILRCLPRVLWSVNASTAIRLIHLTPRQFHLPRWGGGGSGRYSD